MQKWNINYLKQLHTKYSRLAVTTEDITMQLEYESTANSILDIIERYDELNGKRPFLGEIPRYKDTVADDFSVVSKYGYYCPFIRLLGEYDDRLRITPNPNIHRINYNSNKILTVSSDFFHGIGGDVSSYFDGFSRRLKDLVYFKKLSTKAKEAGQTYSIYGTNICFFEVGYNHSIVDYISTIHEFGHGLSAQVNKDSIWDYSRYCFVEVEGLFFEMLGTDYLADVLGQPKDAFDVNLTVLKDYIYSAMLISTKLDMYSMFDRLDLNNRRFVKRYLSNEVGFDKTGIDDVIGTAIRDYMHYIVSYLTAIELYLIYQGNPNKALDILFKIIEAKKEDNKELLDYVRSLGIEPGLNFDKYVETLFMKAKDFKDEKSLQYKN